MIATEQLTNRRLRQENAEQVRQLRQQITERDQLIKEKEDELARTTGQLKENEEIMEMFGKRISELEQKLNQTHQPSAANTRQQPHSPREATNAPLTPSFLRPTATRASPEGYAQRINLIWRAGVKAPCVMTRRCDAIVCGDAVYCQHVRLQKIYLYQGSSQAWFQVPDCPYQYSSIANVNGRLTTIGGGNDTAKTVFGLPVFGGGSYTNKLFCLEENGKWNETLPPMPTKRRGTISLCTGQHLVVIGGEGERNVALAIVEVMDTRTRQWSTASHLPELKIGPSATIVGNHIYIVSGKTLHGKETNSVYMCSIGALVESYQESKEETAAVNVWKRIPDLPVTMSTSVTLCGRLLAVGGRDINNKSTSAVHTYNPATNTWEIVGHMTEARHLCVAAVMNGSQLLVVGGVTDGGMITDSVEIANIIQ